MATDCEKVVCNCPAAASYPTTSREREGSIPPTGPAQEASNTPASQARGAAAACFKSDRANKGDKQDQRLRLWSPPIVGSAGGTTRPTKKGFRTQTHKFYNRRVAFERNRTGSVPVFRLCGLKLPGITALFYIAVGCRYTDFFQDPHCGKEGLTVGDVGDVGKLRRVRRSFHAVGKSESSRSWRSWEEGTGLDVAGWCRESEGSFSQTSSALDRASRRKDYHQGPLEFTLRSVPLSVPMSR
ncbi:hypothetical protein Bbelb_432030 [Branchiostoma belcheri]|nr:hypothetical protein Bbelb_432030 [Branchiostoma belcheri]